MVPVFANYLNKQTLCLPLIQQEPEHDLGLIVIIPACNEPEICQTLASLLCCKKPQMAIEVIVLFNHSSHASLEVKEQNRIGNDLVLEWGNKHNQEKLKFFSLYIDNIDPKVAGVGNARKLLMDEAISRFNRVDNEQGIIVSLDADSTVSENYFTEIVRTFAGEKPPACTIFGFAHPYDIPGVEPEIRDAIVKYELYLRYYRWALAATGFPYPYYTIGSCFSVSALAYVKQGGMNRKQAGEDFYFLNKIFLLNKTVELNHVKVFPSPRASNRVPFGTGAAVNKIVGEKSWKVYQPKAFQSLKRFFDNIRSLYKQDTQIIEEYYDNQDWHLRIFLPLPEFMDAIVQINSNSASETTFMMKFFQWFDAFKMIKYLNFIHIDQLVRIDIAIAAKQLLNQLRVRMEEQADHEVLLEKYREMDNQANIHIFRL